MRHSLSRNQRRQFVTFMKLTLFEICKSLSSLSGINWVRNGKKNQYNNWLCIEKIFSQNALKAKNSIALLWWPNKTYGKKFLMYIGPINTRNCINYIQNNLVKVYSVIRNTFNSKIYFMSILSFCHFVLITYISSKLLKVKHYSKNILKT